MYQWEAGMYLLANNRLREECDNSVEVSGGVAHLPAKFNEITWN